MTRTDPLSLAALLAIAGAVALVAAERAGNPPPPAVTQLHEPAPAAPTEPSFWGFP